MDNSKVVGAVLYGEAELRPMPEDRVIRTSTTISVLTVADQCDTQKAALDVGYQGPVPSR